MSEDISLQLLNRGPQVRMGPRHPDTIELVQFFRLGIDESRQGRRTFIKPTITGHSIEMITNSLKDTINPYVLNPNLINDYQSKKTNLREGRNRLSIHCNRSSHLVFILDRNVEWFYAIYSTPFTASVIDKIDEIYYGPTIAFDIDGEVVHREVVDLNTTDPLPPSRIGYFTFNYDAIPSAIPRDDFFFGFNIHIDLFSEDPSDPPIPITIDPDVGHPGGQGGT